MGAVKSITFFFPLIIAGLVVNKVQGQIACDDDAICESSFREGSVCVDGFCQNPFYRGGCLKNMLPDWDQVRVCTSEDPPEALEKGYCRESAALPYQEVRFNSLNWESAFFSTWIVQILLSEMLGVPATVETGAAGLDVNFYHRANTMDYGPNDSEHIAFENSVLTGGDCTLVANQDPYVPCAHSSLEIWAEEEGYTRDLVETGLMEPPLQLGALAEQYWFIPLYTAERDPSLTHYFGLQDRRKMADTFLTPTSWKDYCDQVSESQCQIPDGVATRAPEEGEEDSMFVAGAYTGHFRKLPEQDCDVYPDTCYGHIGDYPCGWTSFVRQNAYHLGIALKSTGPDSNGGYTYAQLNQIWAAANATGSDAIQMWWKPEALYETYIGTEAEFTHVTLPPPTKNCFDNRALSHELCDAEGEAAAGSPLGACDTAPQALGKGISTTLETVSKNPDVDPALWSPAYQAIQNYKISELEYGQIFKLWLERGVDTYGYDPRHAVCQWIVDNFDRVQSFVPNNYPRTVEHIQTQGTGVFLTGTVIAMIAGLLVIASVFMTYNRRKVKSMYYTNEAFMYLIQGGLLLVAVSSALVTFTISTATCVSVAWLENIGYALILMPLLTRIDAINKLLSSGKQMQRLRVSTMRLMINSLVVATLVVGFLLIWMIIDEPSRLVYYELGSVKDGYTIVRATDYCGSESSIWSTVSLGWRLLLLVFASTIAFAATRVREDLNDTRALSVLLFVHLVFAVLSVATLIIDGSVDPYDMMAYRSIISGIEIIAALLVYVFPKILETSETQEDGEPLPDLFLNTTVLYAEIAGLSAWSSVREPAQVFKFLESIYSAFDNIAEKRRVFKVETIGGTYVAATGIPDDRKDHVKAMAYFAMDMQSLFDTLSTELELVYGPDTGDLSLRIGLHSGAVTGGFLKGKGARFQLFGDTVNIARQIQESTERNRMQVSEKTAQALIDSGKKRWLTARDEKIFITGHGNMQTYWLSTTRKRKTPKEGDSDDDGVSSAGTDFLDEDNLMEITHQQSLDERKRRLVNWNVEVLMNLLKQIIARRLSQQGTRASFMEDSIELKDLTDETEMPLEEVREIIRLPAFDRKAAKRQVSPEDVELDQDVVDQLRFFVNSVAEMYRDNPFHNFSHASHVVLATLKHLNRIIAPAASSLDKEEDEMHVRHKAAAALHDHTYGITSDPLTQFACLFSALIHDMDHPGVPNPQLIKENPGLASTFKERSVAEQNSFQLAWKMLMQDEFKDLRVAICGDKNGLIRFRQLVINSVMATDLGDKQLKELRNARWMRAFHNDESIRSAFSLSSQESSTSFDTAPPEGAPRHQSAASDRINRKATIVIEHLIQASDVSHTMQHWEVYREWNENLFTELYNAYRAGRAEKNPADFWYKGEIGFFDFYIIPLSKKLAECGVFGISSDENLNYANRNRELWVTLGEEATAQMLAKCEKQWDAKKSESKSVAESLGEMGDSLEEP